MVGPEGQLPEIHTQGDPHAAVQLFSLLMNQMNAVDAPEDNDLDIPDSDPAVLALYTPQATNENSSKARKRTFNLDNLRRSVRIRAQSNPDADRKSVV